MNNIHYMKNISFVYLLFIVSGCSHQNNSLTDNINVENEKNTDTIDAVCTLFRLYEEPCFGEISNENLDFYRIIIIIPEDWTYALISYFSKDEKNSCYSFMSKDITRIPFDLDYHQKFNPEEKVRYKRYRSEINRQQWLIMQSLIDSLMPFKSDSFDFTNTLRPYELIIEESKKGIYSVRGINWGPKNRKYYRELEEFIRELNKDIIEDCEGKNF
jgi:hypothetical protein